MKQPAKRACGKCGAELENVRAQCEQILVGLHDRKIRGASREFLGECAEHGIVFARSHIGHHSTYQEAELKRRYPKAIRRTIKDKLTSEQWRRFDAALHGWHSPSEGEKALWDHAAGSSNLSPVTVAIGFPHLPIQVSLGPASLKRNLLTGGAVIEIGRFTQTPR